MSRSIKKTPIHKVAICSAGTMKFWKKECNRKLRRIEGELPQGNKYRRVEDVWTSPSDGKYWSKDPKRMRK